MSLVLHMYLCTYVGMTLNVSMYVTVRLWIDNDVLVRIPPSLKLGDLGYILFRARSRYITEGRF